MRGSLPVIAMGSIPVVVLYLDRMKIAEASKKVAV